MFILAVLSGAGGNRLSCRWQRPWKRVSGGLVLTSALLLFSIAGSGRAAMVLVEDGEPRAVVVTAVEPGPGAGYAAGQLVAFVREASGVTLPVAAETEVPAGYDHRIYIGDTEAARARGFTAVTVTRRAREEVMGEGVRWRESHPVCLLQSDGSDFFIVGNDEFSAGDVLSSGLDGGTLYGVNDLLDRYLGVRWLWPGELGGYVPSAASISFPSAVNRIVTPRFDTRAFRTLHLRKAIEAYDPDHPQHALSFSREGLHDYHSALLLFLVRHFSRDGGGCGQFWGYHLNLWPRYGESNPEFFRLREDSGRGPSPGRSDAAMCVSNPDLHRIIVEEVWDGGDKLYLGEIDDRVYCQCQDCLQWDEPQPADWPLHITSNRYARFWRTVRDLAVEHNPDVRLTVPLYMDYFHAPVIAIDLTGINGRFCPWFSGFPPYYPMDEEDHQRIKRMWSGWRQTGISMGYRPNLFHAGYVMPQISTWQAGEMLLFAHHNGMAGYDFDSMLGHWAARGPMYYVQLRLAARPDLTVAAVRAEFFSAFGPAATKIEEYFDYWEEYSSRKEHPETGGVRYNRLWRADEFYPPASFVPARNILEEAMKLVRDADRDDYAERVLFLQAGLEHARLTSYFISRLGPGGEPPRDTVELAAAREALQQLIEFRRAHEHLFISDYAAAADSENRGFDLESLLAGDPPE